LKSAFKFSAQTKTAAAAAVLVCSVGTVQAALSPVEFETCVRDIASMTVLQQQLSIDSSRLEHEGAALNEVEHQLEAQQAQIAAAREQQAKLYIAAQVIPEAQAAPAKELDQILRATREFRKARVRFNNLVEDYNAKVTTQEERRTIYNAAAFELNARLANYKLRAKLVDARCANSKQD
jgi:chromosome segregation ATPase